MNMFKITDGFLLIFLMGVCAVCSGDVVYLTTGEELTGTVIEETSESVRLKLGSGGIVHLEKKLVKGIRYTVVPDAKDGEKIEGGQLGQIVKIASARNVCKHLQGKLKDKNSLKKLRKSLISKRREK